MADILDVLQDKCSGTKCFTDMVQFRPVGGLSWYGT